MKTKDIMSFPSRSMLDKKKEEDIKLISTAPKFNFGRLGTHYWFRN
jgi:hypothetical protein